MLSRSNITTVKYTLAAIMMIGVSAPSFAASPMLEVTPKQEKLCAKADKRYQELFPDAKDLDGVVTVKLYKYNYCPRNVTVKVGTTVRWVNVDKRTSHSVWLKEAGEAESERFFPDEMWSFKFLATGDYPYLCGPHWESDDMTGFVRVVD